MIILGLTGGIACGKSTIAAVLKELGAGIVDGDRISRALTAPGGAALAPIRSAFGDAVFDGSGRLIRKALGQKVFSDASALGLLNSIMQPLIREEIFREIGALDRQGTAVCVLDMPLLFEENLDSLCDLVWCAYLDTPTQISRLMERDHCTRQQALDRIAAQMSTEEKAARSQLVLSTAGTLEETRHQAVLAYRSLLRSQEESTHE